MSPKVHSCALKHNHTYYIDFYRMLIAAIDYNDFGSFPALSSCRFFRRFTINGRPARLVIKSEDDAPSYKTWNKAATHAFWCLLFTTKVQYKLVFDVGEKDDRKPQMDDDCIWLSWMYCFAYLSLSTCMYIVFVYIYSK